MKQPKDRRRALKNTVLSVLLVLSPGVLAADDIGSLEVAQQQGTPVVAPRSAVVTRAPATVRTTRSYFVEPIVGGGAASEFATTAYGKVGVKARYYLTREMNLGFGVSDAVYTQMYMVISPQNRFTKVTGDIFIGADDLQPIWATEQKIDVEAHVRYRIPIGRGSLSLYPLGGLKGIFFQNGVVNFSMGGIYAGLELSYALGGPLSLEAGGDFLYDLLGAASRQPTTSLFGAPWAATTYGVSLGYRVSPEYRLKVGYDGQTISFQNVSRLYNGLVVSLIF